MVRSLGEPQWQLGELGQIDHGVHGLRVPRGQGEDQLVLPDRQEAKSGVGIRDRAPDEGGVQPPVREPGEPVPDRGGVQLDAGAGGVLLVRVQDGVEAFAEAGDGSDPERAGRGKAGGDGPGGVLGRQHVPGRRKEALAGGRQPHVPGRPVEQFDLQLPLQAPHLLAHRGLAQQQPLGRPAEVQLLGDGDEAAQLS